MTLPYSYLYNAVILPLTPVSAPGGQLFQISASRNDRDVPRMISPPSSMIELRRAFFAGGISELEFQELLRGNRRASGGRDARRLLFTLEQLETMGLATDVSKPAPPPAPTPGNVEDTGASSQSVFPASTV